MIVYDCVEALENVIKIEYSYLRKFNFENIYNYFRYNKDYKNLEKLIKFYGKNLPEKENILYACCEKYNLKMVKMLIDKCCIKVNKNHLSCACQRGNKKIVKYLLKDFDVNENHKIILYRVVVCESTNYKIAKMVLDKFGNKLEIDAEISYLAYLNNKNVFRLLVTTYKEKLPISVCLISDDIITFGKDDKTILLLINTLKENLSNRKSYNLIFNYCCAHNKKDIMNKLLGLSNVEINENHIINSMINYEIFKLVINKFIKQGSKITDKILYEAIEKYEIIKYLVLRFYDILPIDKDFIKSCEDKKIYKLLIKNIRKK